MPRTVCWLWLHLYNCPHHLRRQSRRPPPQFRRRKWTLIKSWAFDCLLAVGAASVKPAISIMSKYPWLIYAHPEITDLMIRIMKVSISHLYKFILITKEHNPSFTYYPRACYGSSSVAYPSPQKPILTLCALTPPSTSTNDFIFFFPNWADRIPISTTLDDLGDVIKPLMHFIGIHVSRDPLFLKKFLCLRCLHLQSTMPIDPVTKKPMGEPDPEDPIHLLWFKILYCICCLPSLLFVVTQYVPSRFGI